MHPLAPNLTDLTDDALQEKTFEIQQKLRYAYNMNNGMLIHQLQMLLQSYSNELQIRQAKQMQELAEKNPQFGDLIDIAKDFTK